MTPLGASLIFVFISIVVSIFRHLFLSTGNHHSDDSNISLTKIHTLTVPFRNPEGHVYNSLYQLYYKPQQNILPPAPQPYNSYTLKKAILNNQGVYICEQKFAAIFQKRISCDQAKIQCKWKTYITVYRLPFLKKQQSHELQVDGRIMDRDGFDNKLECFSKTINMEKYYQINFVVIPNWKQSKQGSSWSMNSLIIEEQIIDWRRGVFIGPFKIKLAKWNLKNIHHNPYLYSFEDKCLSYITKEEPWLIHYNCGTWSSFNILNPEIQHAIFNKKNSAFFAPPFSATHHITPKYLKLFKSTQKIYPPFQSCSFNCERQELIIEKNYLTLVFEIINSPKRFGKLIIQITVNLGDQTQKSLFTSFSIITNQNNLQKATQIDCSIHTKQYQLLKGAYTYQLNLRDQNIVAVLQKHSLMCGFTYQHADQLNIIEIDDVIGNFKINDLPHELILCSQEVLNQKRLQNTLQRRGSIKTKEQYTEEDSSWFDFDIFSFQYNLNENSDKNGIIDGDDSIDIDQKDEKKIKLKKLQKKKKKKLKKERKFDKKIIKFADNPIGQKLEQIADIFEEQVNLSSIQVPIKTVIAPLPLTLNSESQFKIINGDLQFPIIFVEGEKKYFLTYQPKDEEDGKQIKNRTMNQAYSFKYSHINSETKSPEQYVTSINQTLKQKKREELELLDKFILDLAQNYGGILNQISSISVVDAKYDDGVYHLRLSGMNKPYKKQIIVAWGWGIEVYEINWDRKGIKSQIIEIEQQLQSKNSSGIEMAILIPFIELFATVYCLFQALIHSR